jgi:hypothetical protein
VDYGFGGMGQRPHPWPAVQGVVKPILISRTGKTPLILVMLRVIGGALVFGFIRIHRTDAARCRLRVDRRMERPPPMMTG